MPVSAPPHVTLLDLIEPQGGVDDRRCLARVACPACGAVTERTLIVEALSEFALRPDGVYVDAQACYACAAKDDPANQPPAVSGLHLAAVAEDEICAWHQVPMPRGVCQVCKSEGENWPDQAHGCPDDYAHKWMAPRSY